METGVLIIGGGAALRVFETAVFEGCFERELKVATVELGVDIACVDEGVAPLRGVIGGVDGTFGFASEVCGLDAVIPQRDKHFDFQPMHLDTAIVRPDCRTVEVVRSDRDRVLVESGLETGDLVVSSSLDAVTDGMIVRISEAGGREVSDG